MSDRFRGSIACFLVLGLVMTVSPVMSQSGGEYPAFEEGLQAYFQGNNSEALKAFKRAVSAEEDNARYHFFLGNTYNRLGRDTMAIKTYKRVLSRNSNHETARRRLADLHYKNKKWNASIRHYKRLTSDTNAGIDVHFRLARSLFEQGRLGRSKKHFLEVRQRAPRRSDVYFYLGRILLEQEEPLNAISRLNRAIQIDDSRGRYYFYRGLAHFRQEDYLSQGSGGWQSASDFQKALDLGHQNPRTNFMLGNSLLNRGLYLLREEREETAISHLQKSIRQYRQVLAGEWNASNAYHNMGVAYLGIGKLEMARKSIEQAILIEPTIPFFHDTLGDVYFRQGQFGKAIESWELVRELDSDYDGNPFRKLLETDSISEKIKQARIRR